MKQHTIIYGRTEAGEAVLAGKGAPLDARLRRFLGLVDGKRAVAELETVSRPSELHEILGILQNAGYIAKVGENRLAMSGVEMAQSDPFAAAAMTPQMFARLKYRAVTDLEKRIGAAAKPVCARIDAAATPAELRRALRECGAELNSLLGESAAQEFLQGIGRNLVA